MAENKTNSVSFEEWLAEFERQYQDETDTLCLLEATGAYKVTDPTFSYPSQIDSFERGLGYFIESKTDADFSVELTSVCLAENRPWPPSITLVEEADWNVWRSIPSISTHPIVRIHFLALLTSDRQSERREIARQLVSESLALSERYESNSWALVQRLRLAIEIARKFSLGTGELRRELFQRAQLEVENVKQGNPGLCLEALKSLSLTSGSQGEHPTSGQILELLGEVAGMVRDQAMAHNLATELMVRLEADSQKKSLLRRGHAGVLLTEALTAEVGLGRQSLLLETIDYAKRYHVHDIREKATIELQSISVDDLQLQRLGVEMPIPAYVFDLRKKFYEKSNSFGEALYLWLHSGSPTGSFKRNAEQARALAKGRVISQMDGVILNEYGLPIRRFHGEQGVEAEELRRQEELTAFNAGTCLAAELDFIASKFLSENAVISELQYFFDAGINEELLEELGRVLRYFWDQDYTAAGRAAFPLIEAGMRGFLLTCEEPIFRTETGEASGKFPSLETYAEQLRKLNFDEDWLRAITGVVADLRNGLAHGHKLSVNRMEAAILIRTAGLFVVISHLPRTQLLDSESQILDPLGWGSGQRLWKWEDLLIDQVE